MLTVVDKWNVAMSSEILKRHLITNHIQLARKSDFKKKQTAIGIQSSLEIFKKMQKFNNWGTE